MKVLKNALCFIMGYLVAMVIRAMLFVLVQFFILYIVQVKSMCVLTRNILKPTRSLYDFRFKSYGSNSGFRVFGDLDLDLCSIFLSHALRMMYLNIHAKFH